MRRFLYPVVLLCLAAALFPRGAAAATYTTSAAASPSTVVRGTSITLDALVKSDTAMSMLVDLEVYRPDGQKVHQQYWDGQAFAAGQQRSFRSTWAVPADAPTGTYSVRIGLFSVGWGTMYHWNGSAGQFTVSGSAPGGSGGLTGQYYDNADFTGLKLTRTDATVNFNWGSGAPAAGMGADSFSVRWQGRVRPQYSQTYTFTTLANDGVRLWVNGKQLINDWTPHAAAERSGTIALTAEQQYDIRLEYFEDTNSAQVQLFWASPSQARELIPQSRLSPTTPATPTATPVPATATRVPATATRVPATATRVPATATPAPATATAGTGRYFSTLPPGSALPSDAECAAAVKRRPENKRMNATYNATRGNQQLASDFFGGSDPRANSQIAPRVTGNFTGTTDEILQWTACKWGIDEDIVRAQAATESWWQQTAKGDWTSDANLCAPGHGLGVDGRAGQCPESFGILQNRYPYEKSAWPSMYNSTAFNADTAYAYWRVCYEGYEWWLNSAERGQQYAAGDVWGCVGRWFAGRWYTAPANDYASRVRANLDGRVWEQPGFQEP